MLNTWKAAENSLSLYAKSCAEVISRCSMLNPNIPSVLLLLSEGSLPEPCQGFFLLKGAFSSHCCLLKDLLASVSCKGVCVATQQ